MLTQTKIDPILKPTLMKHFSPQPMLPPLLSAPQGVLVKKTVMLSVYLRKKGIFHIYKYDPQKNIPKY